MNTKTLEQCEVMDEMVLSNIEGGGKNAADAFLTGFGGAVQGVVFCAQTGAFVPLQVYAVCAAGGAAASLIWSR